MNDEIDRHGRRTAWLCIRLCEVLGMPVQQARDVALAAVTHDIGKHDLPAHVLEKPALLTSDERTCVERHCMLGATRLSLAAPPDDADSTTAAVAVALSHHEWWNGAGYPFGLAGEAIPKFARIVAVADVFDALMSVRPYKAAWKLHEAIDYIAVRRATQFDPSCADAMLQTARALPLDWMLLAEGRGVLHAP